MPIGFELPLQVAGLLVLGVMLYESYHIRGLLNDRTMRFMRLEERMGKIENKLDQAVLSFRYLDRFKPGKDDPT